MNPERVSDYAWSLPERFLRSVTGLAAGTARELGIVILPSRVRRSRLYDSIVESTLRFLIEQVGQIEKTSTAAEPLPEDFLIRRAVGTSSNWRELPRSTHRRSGSLLLFPTLPVGDAS